MEEEGAPPPIAGGAVLAPATLQLPVVGIDGSRIVQIQLNAQEVAIFSALLQTVQARGLRVKVRVAGGWVRDKLMGRSSHDIDVALDTMMGAEFAAVLNEYLTSRGESVSSVAVIQANPDQSKHLETATARVMGLWLDFVNLRAETYEAGSRIPLVGVGTPKQDAERRDFTINSLLYNLSDGCIEDWTGQGLADIQAGLLRTPIPAAITFRDDPLRVLRAVRFSSRFGFTLDPSLTAACRDPVVQRDLVGKVSRERYGIEVDGMLAETGRPVAALRTLHHLGLTGIVFAPPPGKLAGVFLLPGVHPHHPAYATLPPDAVAAAGAHEPTVPPSWPTVAMGVVEATAFLCSLAARCPESAGWLVRPGSHLPIDDGGAAGDVTPLLAAVAPWPPLCFHTAENAWEAAPETSPDDTPVCGLTPEDRRLLLLAAQVSPLSGLFRVTPKGKEEPLVALILTESVKRRQKDGADVLAILSGAAALDGMARGGGGGPTRLALGTALRGVAKEHWRLSILLAAAVRLLPVLLDPGNRQAHAGSVPPPSAAAVVSVLLPFARLHACVRAWGLEGVWEWKHLLTGAEVLAGLGLKPGPAMGPLMEELMQWQICRTSPVSEGDKPAALAHLRGVVAEAGGAAAIVAKYAPPARA